MSRDFKTRPTHLGTNLALVTDATATGLMNVVEVDLGSTPRRSGSFQITTTGLTAGQHVIIEQINGPYTAKGTLADEAEMDRVSVTGQATSSTVIQCYWTSPTVVKGNFKFAYTLVSTLNTVPDATTTTPGLLNSAFQETYIDGLDLVWSSGTSITVTTGAAWVPSVSRVVNVASDITLTSGTDFTLAASKWYYVYLTNTGTIAVVRDDGTNPTPATPYKGTARTRTSNTNQRYLGALKSNVAGTAILKFRDAGTTRHWLETTLGAPLRVLSAGAATTSTSVSCAGAVSVSSRSALASLTNATTDTSANFFYTGFGDLNGALTSGNFSFVTYPNTVNSSIIELSSTQTFNYFVSSATGSPAYCDIYGYIEER